MNVNPVDLWTAWEESWVRIQEAFKKEEQDYVNFCSSRCNECIGNLKKYYQSHGEDFDKIWKNYLLERKRRTEGEQKTLRLI